MALNCLFQHYQHIKNMMQSQQIGKETQYSLSSSIQFENSKKKVKCLKQMNHCGINWTFEQIHLYVQFLKENKKLFKNDFSKRSSKIFLQMSLFICSKSTRQCRTYHNTMVKKFLNFKNIEKYLLKNLKEKKEFNLINSMTSTQKNISVENSSGILCQENGINIIINIEEIPIW